MDKNKSRTTSAHIYESSMTFVNLGLILLKNSLDHLISLEDTTTAMINIGTYVIHSITTRYMSRIMNRSSYSRLDWQCLGVQSPTRRSVNLVHTDTGKHFFAPCLKNVKSLWIMPKSLLSFILQYLTPPAIILQYPTTLATSQLVLKRPCST